MLGRTPAGMGRREQEGEGEGISAVDSATREILEECAAIRLKIPKASVSSSISAKEWSNHWSRAKEETSSSLSR